MFLEPEPPAAPIVLNYTIDSITVQWNQPTENGRPIDIYEVLVESEGLPSVSFLVNATGTFTSEVLSPLRDSTVFNISVRAHNEIGWGPYGVPTEQATLFAPPPPIDGSSSNISWYWFTVEFELPGYASNPPRSIEVVVSVFNTVSGLLVEQKSNLQSIGSREKEYTPPPYFFNFTLNINSGTNYTYSINTTIEGKNREKVFTLSGPYYVQTLSPTIPSKISQFNLDYVFTRMLSFSYTRAHENGSPIQGYKITCNSTTTNVFMQLAVNITSLEPDTYYACYVQAYNGIGDGPASDTIFQKTYFGASQMLPPFVESPTTDVLRIHWNRGSAALDSTLPTAGNRWLVQMTNSSVCGSECTKEFIFSANSGFWTGLNPNTLYGFAVSISFDGGRSPPFSDPSFNSTQPLITTAEVTTGELTTGELTTGELTTSELTTSPVT